MLVRTRTRLAYLSWMGLFFCATLFSMIHYGSNPPPLALAPCLVVIGLGVYISRFWPRCPHCGARVIRNEYDGFWSWQRCWSCRQPYDGPPLSSAEEDARILEMIRRREPAVAAELEREEREFQALRQAASESPAAAGNFRQVLQDRIDGLVAYRSDLQSGAAGPVESPAIRRLLEDASGKLEGLKAELKQIPGSTGT